MGGKVLILGASGFIGRSLVERLDGDCVATFNSKPRDGWVKFDAVVDRVADLPLDGVSHAVVLSGNTNPDACCRDRAASDALNIDAVCRACDDLGTRGIRVIFASTEAVFDGRKGRYVETDPVSPMLVYGAQKIAVERHLERHWPRSAVVRIGKVYGSRVGDGSLIDGWYRQALAGGEIRCAADFISSAIHVDDVVDAILAIVAKDLTGLFHLGGPVGISRLAMFEAVLAAMAERGPVGATAVGCSIDDFPTLEGRPKDVSMVCDKIVQAAGLSFRTVEQACRDYVAGVP